MKSIKSITTNTITIKKSEFITTLIPCSNEEEIKELLNEYSRKDATHNCYAYIVGNSIKTSDDGEPSQTAGMPMLNVLEKQELTNIIAIVTRYFGGIKLGTGGLSRAYSQSVSEALKLAKIIETVPATLYEITLDYHYIKKFEHLMKTCHIPCINTDYSDQVTYSCYLINEDFLETVRNMTSNQFSYKKIRQDYIEKV